MSGISQENSSDAVSHDGSISYVVTHGKPLRETQFKPGQSGNPGDRPEGSKNFRTLVQLQLDDTVTATVTGKQRKVTKRGVIAMRLIDKALKGDQKTIETITKFSEEAATASSPATLERSPYLEVLSNTLARIKRGEVRRLPITIPPRHLKSISTSIASPACVFGRDPTRCIITATYARDLPAIAEADRSPTRSR